jgi:hypothetical protein
LVTNSDLVVIYALVAVNIPLYFMLYKGYQRDKRMFKIPRVASPKEAFDIFERSYRQAFPQEREGFTWGEAMKKAGRFTELSDFQWAAVQKSLKQYEAYRYAGIGEINQIDTSPILKLAMVLREKRYYA